MLRNIPLALALLPALSIAGQTLTKPPAFDKTKAVSMLYGGELFRSRQIKDYFPKQDYVYPRLVFDQAYVQQGQHKHIVVMRLSPQPGDEYFCHACHPLLGAAVFNWTDQQWQVESKNLLLGWGNSFDESFKLVKIGPDRHAILDSIEDVHQGFQDKRIRLIVAHQASMQFGLDFGFNEKPSTDACGSGGYIEQEASLRFVKSNQEFFDVITKLNFNDGSCDKFKVRKQTMRYRYVDGRYQEAGR